ncbi:MAG: helix-turn-helix domain-containing protein [Rikenella sp.]|nr:helix-turn-helix domain-containing protein [Rikenella sp.]
MKNRLDTKLERERIGRIVRARREELRLTLRELSTESGVALGALSQLERGHNFSAHTLIRVCDTLDLRISVVTEVG